MTWRKTLFRLLWKCGSDDEWFLYRLYFAPGLSYGEGRKGKRGESMSDEQFYKDSIVKMIFSICNTDWLRSIYSFVKVFADDKEGEE